MNKYLEVGLEAVKAAEKVILQYFNEGNFDEQRKSDDSPVTVADKEAQKIISDIILKNFPDHFILGEEDVEQQDLADKEFVWIIDPIDGTANYTRGIKVFSTELALMKNGKIVLGISSAPLLDELMYAEEGGGAFLNGKPIRVSSINELRESYICYGGIKYLDQDGLSGLVKLAKHAKCARGYGNFWGFHLLAEGKLDGVVIDGEKIWDIAALAVIIEEAGGKITDLQGNPLTLKSTSALASNGLLHEEIKAYFSEAL